MKRTLAALGLVALAGTSAFAATATEPAATPDKMVDMRPAPAGPDGPGPRRGGPDGPRREFGRPNPQMFLATQLAAAETLVGIRSNQLDAWRDYTSALLALVAPPKPPQPEGMGPGAPQAFAREEALARMIADRAVLAEKLTKAIGVLRGTLTEDQLARLANVDLRLRPMRPPMGPHGPGPMGHGMGPGMMGPGGMGMGPEGMGPEGMGSEGMGPGGMGHPGMRHGDMPMGAGPMDGPDEPGPQDDGPADPGAPPTP